LDQSRIRLFGGLFLFLEDSMRRLLTVVVVSCLVLPPQQVCAEPEAHAHAHSRPHAHASHGGASVALALLAHSITSIYALPDNVKDPVAWTELAVHITELFSSLGSLSFMGTFAQKEVLMYTLMMVLSMSLMKSRHKDEESASPSVTALNQLSDSERAGQWALRQPLIQQNSAVFESALEMHHRHERAAAPPRSSSESRHAIQRPRSRRWIGRRTPDHNYKPFLDEKFQATPEARAALREQETFASEMIRSAAASPRHVEVIQ
jgi:hypothetical protein